MYANASFSTEEFEACVSAMAGVLCLHQCPGLGHCSPLGLLYQSEYGYVGTLLPTQCRLVRADYRLLLFSSAWRNVWTHHVRRNFRVLYIREGFSYT